MRALLSVPVEFGRTPSLRTAGTSPRADERGPLRAEPRERFLFVNLPVGVKIYPSRGCCHVNVGGPSVSDFVSAAWIDEVFFAAERCHPLLRPPPGEVDMGYTRRRAVLSEIERLCSLVLLAYEDSADALKAGEADRFWRSLELLRVAAEQLGALLWPTAAENEMAEWLGVPEMSPLHLGSPESFREPPHATPLPDCARFFDADA